jgi:hypothetical protein
VTLAKKIQQVLKDELKPENIKTVIDLAEFLKFGKHGELKPPARSLRAIRTQP